MKSLSPTLNRTMDEKFVTVSGCKIKFNNLIIRKTNFIIKIQRNTQFYTSESSKRMPISLLQFISLIWLRPDFTQSSNQCLSSFFCLSCLPHNTKCMQTKFDKLDCVGTVILTCGIYIYQV